MVISQKKKQKPQIIEGLIVLILSFVFVYPLWQCFVLSVGDSAYAVKPGFKFWPTNFSLAAYKVVFSGKSIWIGYGNTIWRAFFGTLLTLVLTYCCAYGMRYKEMPGVKVLNFLFVFTMYFGGGIVPTFILIKDLGLMNNRLVYILPGAVGAYNIMVMRSFINSLGRELEESAYIDGANPMQIMLRIYVPLSKPIMAVIGLWSVVGHWGAYLDHIMYAPDAKFLLLQNVVRNFTEQARGGSISGGMMATAADMTPLTVQYATIMCIIVPILVGYPFIQKYLVKGTMIGALKG